MFEFTSRHKSNVFGPAKQAYIVTQVYDISAFVKGIIQLLNMIFISASFSG